MKKISVVVPVYNAENGLRDCVRSLQAQEYSNIEIILVNDGSKDGSLKICNELAEKDNRIKVFDGVNQGVSCARNRGIQAATGEYIAFVDADDMVRNDIYIKMMEIAESGKYGMVFCNYFEFNDSGYRCNVDQLTQFKDKPVKARHIVGKLISAADDSIFGVVWRCLFKAEVAKSQVFTPGLTMAEDLQFLLKCLRNMDYVGICPEFLYDFRVSDQSTTGKYMEKQDEDMRFVNNWMEEYSKDYDVSLLDNVKICMANTLVLNIANVCKQGTPYDFFARCRYADAVMNDPKYKDAVYTAIRHRDVVVGKRYIQLKMMVWHMSWVNVLYHSLKNKTLTKFRH